MSRAEAVQDIARRERQQGQAIQSGIVRSVRGQYIDMVLDGTRKQVRDVILPKSIVAIDVGWWVVVVRAPRSKKWIAVAAFESMTGGSRFATSDLSQPSGVTATGKPYLVALSWDGSFHDESTYEVQHNSAGSETGATTIKVEGSNYLHWCNPGTERYFRVRAVSSSYERSSWSAWVNAAALDGNSYMSLCITASGDVSWMPFRWDDVSGVIQADMVHDHSVAAEGGEIPLTSLGSYAEGSIILGGAADWVALSAKTEGAVLMGTGTTVVSDTTPTFKDLVTIDQDVGNRRALVIDSEATSEEAQLNYGWKCLYLRQDISDGYALYAYRALAEAGANPLASFVDDNAANTQATVYIRQDGTGPALDFGGGTGTNRVRFPDALANAMHFIDDTTGINFQQFVTTAGAQATVFNNGEVDVDFRVAASGVTNALFVQGSTGAVCIGTGTPGGIFHVVHDTYDILFDKYSNNPFPIGWYFRKARGTEALPLVVQAGDTISNVVSKAYDGAGWDSVAGIQVKAQSVAAGNISGQLIFRLTDTSGTLTTRMSIDENGYALIGASTTPATPATLLELEATETLTADVADDYAACVTLDPGYTGAFQVDRHNYIDVQRPSVAGGASVVAAPVFRFDAAIGTHESLAAAFQTTDSNGDTTDWALGLYINVLGTLYKLAAIAA